jgi:hypothetical protein
VLALLNFRTLATTSPKSAQRCSGWTFLPGRNGCTNQDTAIRLKTLLNCPDHTDASYVPSHGCVSMHGMHSRVACSRRGGLAVSRAMQDSHQPKQNGPPVMERPSGSSRLRPGLGDCLARSASVCRLRGGLGGNGRMSGILVRGGLDKCEAVHTWRISLVRHLRMAGAVAGRAHGTTFQRTSKSATNGASPGVHRGE